MINIFSNGYYFIQFGVKVLNLTVLLKCDEYEYNILTLYNPKLIGSRNSSSSGSFSKVSIETVVNSVSDSKSLYIGKFDKKYKSSVNEQDLLKAKKYKGKSSKNRRINNNNEDINDVKILVKESDDLLNNDSLNKSNIKSRKPGTKSKKKNRSRSSETDNNNLELLTQPFNSDQSTNTKKSISLVKPLTVSELSDSIQVPEAEIITYLFIQKSISARINDLLDLDMVRTIAENYGFVIIDSTDVNYESSSIFNQPLKLLSTVTRSPLITIMGHVDHGKTTLLDALLKTNLANNEIGGITQAISSYEITCKRDSKDYRLVFFDTPGHESFKSMRLRGAQVTDIILLIIAVDDGLKQQTIEAINYINQMDLSCIVVLTKIDKLIGNVDNIKNNLSNYNLISTEWGGTTPFVEVSALTSQNIDELITQICIMSDKKNLVADLEQKAFGMIIEAYLDKRQGPIANVVIQNGTLRLGDMIISNNLIGKVKSITDISNEKIKFSGPSSVVQVLAFNSVPKAGSLFYSFDSEIDAKKYIKQHSDKLNNNQFESLIKSLNTRITSDINVNVKKLNLIIKTDTQGSLEAILDLLSTISQSKVQINIIYANFGNISNADVQLALTTNSCIIAFNVTTLLKISSLLKKYKVDVKVFNVIYDLFEYVRDTMLNLIDAEYDYLLIGNATVKTVFKMNKGLVAGCLVNEGKLSKNSYIRVYRNGSIEYEGFITSLKHMKNDVDEVLVSTECGLMSDFESWQQSDIIKAYKLVTQEKIL